MLKMYTTISVVITIIDNFFFFFLNSMIKFQDMNDKIGPWESGAGFSVASVIICSMNSIVLYTFIHEP